jgi:dephospho-CoA kinase
MVIGLTGGYCAGKDAVARILAARGFSVIDVDSLGHDALRAKPDEVAAAFGPSVRSPDGSIDRKALGKIVFSDPAALALLESIVHPVMVAEVTRRVAAIHGDILINAAILRHMGLHSLCDAVVCVRAPMAARLLRALRRDRLSVRAALARIRAQKGICGLPRHGFLAAQFNDSPVDTYTVRNRGSMRSLERRVARLDRRLRG